MFHCALEVSWHHAHHNWTVVYCSSNTTLTANMNCSSGMQRSNHTIAHFRRTLMAGQVQGLFLWNLLLYCLLVIVVNWRMRVDCSCHSVWVVLGLHDVWILINSFILHLLILLNRRKLKDDVITDSLQLTLKESSSLERVLFWLRYSPLIISLSSGNFFVGRTFFLSTFLVPWMFPLTEP